MADSYVYKFGCGSQNGFNADDSWLKKQMQLGRVCDHGDCCAIIPDRVSELDEIVVGQIPHNLHVGYILDLFHGEVLSEALVDLIGTHRLRRISYLIPIAAADSESNRHKDRYFYVVSKQEHGCVRGSARTKPSRCKKCGRLFYWPLDVEYVLREYWPVGTNVAILDATVLVSAKIYEEVIKPMKLNMLTGKRIPLADTPTDNYPPKFEDLLSAIKKRV